MRETAGGEAEVTGLIREGEKRRKPHANTLVRAGDVVQLEGEPDALHKLIADLGWQPHRAEHAAGAAATGEVRSVEAVVGGDSALIGQTVRRRRPAVRATTSSCWRSRAAAARPTQRLRAARDPRRRRA